MGMKRISILGHPASTVHRSTICFVFQRCPDVSKSLVSRCLVAFFSLAVEVAFFPLLFFDIFEFCLHLHNLHKETSSRRL